LGLRSNSANATSSYDFLIYVVSLNNVKFSNKIQLKNNLFTGLDLVQCIYILTGPGPTMNSRDVIHCSLCKVNNAKLINSLFTYDIRREAA
jgi:hypothetical protein